VPQQSVQIPQYAYTNPPSSPGPLPLKIREAPQRSDTLSIEPDANPLQSPKNTYFPPPATPALNSSQAPPVGDLSAFHQPGQIMHPNQEVQGGTWTHGLCDCSNIGTCCVGVICPCILYGKTQHRLTMKSRKEDPTNMLGYDTCNGSCSAMALFCGCQCNLSMPFVLNPAMDPVADTRLQGFWQPYSTRGREKRMELKEMFVQTVFERRVARAAL
jgi:Cys-rich protein (TIGR01571 family)